MSDAHATTAPRLSPRAISLGDIGGSVQSGLGVIGAGALAVGILVGFNGWLDVSPTFFWRSYLVAFCFVLSMSLGGLFFVFVQHLTRAGWSVAVRRPAEVLASNLRWLWLLWVVPFGWLFMKGQAGVLWSWADPAAMQANDPAQWHLVEKKIGYFSLFGLFHGDFFWARAILYFAIWAGLAQFFLVRSLRLGATGDRGNVATMQKVAAPAAILFALSITFAAFDWIMSISPAWFSTMFGVYFFAGCCTAGFSVIILVCLRLQQLGYLKGVITAEHYQDLGKMLFAFGIVFWAYIAFSQYMLIWYANIPEETGWYLARQLGGWGWMSLALLFGHFVIPFLFLVSRWTKRIKLWLAVGAVWMLLFSWIDLYWLVMPEIPPHLNQYETYDQVAAKYGDTSTHLADPVNWFMLVGIMGCVASFTIFRLREHPLLCRRDPRLAESLAFENM